VTADPIPPAAVIRVSRGNFDPARFPEVQEMTVATGRFLILLSRGCPALSATTREPRPMVPWSMSASGSPTSTHSR
jgi:hypothetical protein